MPALFVALVVLMGSCGPERRSALHDVRIRLTQVAHVDQPVAMAIRSDDPAFYVVEKKGRIKAIRGERARTVLDLSADVSTGPEQGLLGLAFSADGRFMYINYTNTDGDTRVVEYRFQDGRADRRSARLLLALDQPFPEHNGGQLTFGPDGYLYIGLGDGGSEGDPYHHAQSLKTLFGKVLRIDPRPTTSAPYRVPSDNPFVRRAGARDEIWAYGLRNPWRFSFDRATGDLYIGDVGAERWEEVDFAPASSTGGENYGWALREGNQRFKRGRLPSDYVPPVYVYAHSTETCDFPGRAIVGGYVYRGSKIPALRGAYVFADYCSGRLRALNHRRGRLADHRMLGQQVTPMTSFAEDSDGELYVLGYAGRIFRIDPA